MLVGVFVLKLMMDKRGTDAPAGEILAEDEGVTDDEVPSDNAGSGSGDDTSADEPVQTPDPYEITDFKVKAVSDAKPSRMMEFTNISVDGDQLEKISDYVPDEQIEFDTGAKYTELEGVITFRGNNFRDAPVFGTAPMKKYKMKKMWSVGTSSLTIGNQYWSGNGWTGQPLLMHWPRQTKQHMNMEQWAKDDDELVEAIYASLDGNIYFIDIKSGRQTRPVMKTGFVFKGAGALDPRGYPLLYVGSGYNSPGGTSRAFIISLIDCSVLYEYGNIDPFSLRGSLSFFDSSPLVDAETDTLIEPGENGILYLIRLNTKYNEKKGKISVKPGRIVKWRYKGKRNSGSSYWYGMESSAAIYKGYLYVCDNGGHMMCLDLNTLKLKWVQDILDDSNGSPVLSVENGKLYLYVSTSFHLGWRSSSAAEIPIWKMDAATGEIIWKTSYTCHSVEGNSGGVQSTIAVGHESLDDYIYVTVAKTDGLYRGVIVALKKKNGRKAWEQDGPYTWSSPVCVYNTDESGKDVVIYARSDSNLMMLDGVSGETEFTLNLGSGNIEASPAVYNNILVLGTRGMNICGVKLK
ncbi:MAG: PQQ-binding-like beta-propeller repeat protein [Eubacterium sp.]|nr:PQQ-binding-like beta-propeller repeat protein [Eubacterium sp.]